MEAKLVWTQPLRAVFVGHDNVAIFLSIEVIFVPRPWELAIPTAIFLSGHDMILSDEKIYNLLKQRANSIGYIRISRLEIGEHTGLSHRAIQKSLCRLMESQRLWWERPQKEQPDKFKTAFYKIDPTISRFDYGKCCNHSSSPRPGILEYPVRTKREASKHDKPE